MTFNGKIQGGPLLLVTGLGITALPGGSFFPKEKNKECNSYSPVQTLSMLFSNLNCGKTTERISKNNASFCSQQAAN